MYILTNNQDRYGKMQLKQTTTINISVLYSRVNNGMQNTDLHVLILGTSI